MIALFIYAASSLQPRDETPTLRQWLAKLKAGSRNAKLAPPVWVLGFLAFTVIVVASSLATQTAVALSLILFLLRDLILLDGSRHFKFKQSKTFIVWVSALLYFIPFISTKLLPEAAAALMIPQTLVGNWKSPTTYLMTDLLPGHLSYVTLIAINIVSGLVQVVIAWWLMRRLERSQTT
jgi:hypothetical protein